MSYNARFDPPSDLYYSSMEYFECPYNHECENCEFDCGDDLE